MWMLPGCHHTRAFYSLILILQNSSSFKKGQIWALLRQVQLYIPLLYSGLISAPANLRFKCVRISVTEHGISPRPSQFQQRSHEDNDISKWICVTMWTQQAQPAVGIQLIGTLTTIRGYSVARKRKHMKEVVLKYIYSILYRIMFQPQLQPEAFHSEMTALSVAWHEFSL